MCQSVFGQENRSYFVCFQYINNSNARNFKSLHSLLEMPGNGVQERHQDLLHLSTGLTTIPGLLHNLGPPGKLPISASNSETGDSQQAHLHGSLQLTSSCPHMLVTTTFGTSSHFSSARKISHKFLSLADYTQNYTFKDILVVLPPSFLSMRRRPQRWYRGIKLTTNTLVEQIIIIIPILQLTKVRHREVN